MKRSLLTLLQCAWLLGLPTLSFAQTIELQAISDFTNRESGAVPYYLDIAGGRDVLAINAADPSYRNKFARAEHEFTGPDGIYNITINALGEVDGDGTYRLLVNGIVQGVAVNPPVSTDYLVISHTFEGIALTAPTTIGIESNAVSNNTIPEGDGYAFARGRWRSVTLENQDSDAQSTANSVDLGIALSTIDTLIQQGGSAPFIVSIINNDQTTIATAPAVEFMLPDTLQFKSSDVCIPDRSIVRCLLPEIAPGGIATARFIADIDTAEPFNLSATISSDQADSDLNNNNASLSLESKPAEVTTDSEVVVNEPDTSAEGGNDTNDTGNSTTSEPESTDNNMVANATKSTGAFGAASVFALLLYSLIRVQMSRRYGDDKSAPRSR